MKLALIPPGSYSMGPDNGTQVPATLTRPFYLGQTEVTQAQWKKVMGTEPWRKETNIQEGDNFSATSISWDMATEFCRELTNRERLAGHLQEEWAYVLPTEAQWEYACRAGSTTAYSFGDDESQLGDYAWYGRNASQVNERYVHQVGQKRSNAFGLYDMHGNVWEWCHDGYAAELSGGTDPEVTTGATDRVRRGGSWGNPAKFCQSAFRGRLTPDFRNEYLGFRVAKVQVR